MPLLIRSTVNESGEWWEVTAQPGYGDKHRGWLRQYRVDTRTLSALQRRGFVLEDLGFVYVGRGDLATQHCYYARRTPATPVVLLARRLEEVTGLLLPLVVEPLFRHGLMGPLPEREDASNWWRYLPTFTLRPSTRRHNKQAFWGDDTH